MHVGDAEASVNMQPITEHHTCQVTELGLADKVQLGWDSPWWGNDPLDLQVIFTEDLPGEMVSKTNKPKKDRNKIVCH